MQERRTWMCLVREKDRDRAASGMKDLVTGAALRCWALSSEANLARVEEPTS